MAYANPTPNVTVALSDAFEVFFQDDINRTHARRMTFYRQCWLYYLGRHWSYIRDVGDPVITMNYARKIVDLHSDFTFGKGFDVVIPDNPETQENETEDREFIRAALEEAWRKNNKQLWCLEAGQQGGVTGDVFARVSWERSDPLEDPYPRVDIIPSHLVFPEFGGPFGVDRKKVTRAIIITPTYRERDLTKVRGLNKSLSMMTSVDMILKVEEWIAAVLDPMTGAVVRPSIVRYYENRELISENINPLGEIPLVHIPNYPLSGEYYGISDLVDIMDLNREMNEKVTDISDIVNYHASPQTVIYGAKLKDLEKGANRTWALPEGAKVENLELKGDLNAANTHWENLKRALLELSNTPEQALGTQKSLTIPSGVSMQMMYLPMIQKRDIKVLTYGYGLRLINRLMLKFMEIADPAFSMKLNSLKGNKYRNEVSFEDPLPQDERRQLEISREKLSLGISTRRLELEARGYSQRETDKIIEEAREDLVEDNEEGVAFDYVRKQGSGFAKGGSDETRGEKIGSDKIDKAAGVKPEKNAPPEEESETSEED